MRTGLSLRSRLIIPIIGTSTALRTAPRLANPSMRNPLAPPMTAAFAKAAVISGSSIGPPSTGWHETTKPFFKTSKAVYDDHLIQASAYTYMIKEQDDIEIDKFILARFGKESEDFQIVDFSKSNLNKGFQYFKVLRKAYDLDREVSKLTRKLIKNERSK